MDMRELKALEIAARCRLTYDGVAWTVPSQSGKGTYRVTLATQGNNCNCDDFSLRGKDCKHVLAARLVQARDHNGLAPTIDTSAVPKKPTYAQDWPAYNLAQNIEKHRFQVLLHDLCQGVEEPVREGSGRRPHLVKDAIFAAVFKVYSTVSSRRFDCDLKDAHACGFTTKPLPGMKVNSFLENEDFTAVLRSLIIESSKPLAAVDVDFAADSSGFSTSRFVRWFDEKYGVERSGHDWVKAHLMCGVKTHIVTAVEILERCAGDSPQFKQLLNKTAENFTIGEVSMDKAYLSKENFELVAEKGGEAFIAFKVNSVDGSGGIWDKMFNYFKYRREEFLTHYHQRSNVETVFSMIKAKFRDHVRSKTDTAMKNEVLCKILAHNICCLIMAQCELGIESVFWDDMETDGSEKDTPRLLRLPQGN